MNAFRIAALRTAVAATLYTMLGAAAAQEATPWPELDNLRSTRTRAEVAAEAADALRRGLIPRTEADDQHAATAGFRGGKTRIQVIAEMHEARRLGLMATTEAELNRVRTATPAEAELIAAAGRRANGEKLAGPASR